VTNPKSSLNTYSFCSNSPQKEYYLSAPHKRAWAHLNFAIKQGNGILLLSGQNGCGKSTIVQLFTEKLREEGVKFTYFSAISNFIDLTQIRGQRLIAIDDAELLNTKQLQNLNHYIEFANEQLLNLQFLLIGSEKLEQLFADNKHSNFRKKIVFSYQLGLMNPTDTMRYAQLQLAANGWHINTEVANKLLRDLYSYSSGNPELINKFLDQLQAANKLHNEQQSSYNRNSLTEPQTLNDLNSGVTINAVNDTNTDNQELPDNIPWFKSKKFKAIGLSYLTSMVIAVLAFHSVGFLDQNTKNNQYEVLTSNQSINVPVVAPLTSAKKIQPVENDIIEIGEVRSNESLPTTKSEKLIVKQNLPEQIIQEKIKNKPLALSNNNSMNITEISRKKENEIEVLAQKKENEIFNKNKSVVLNEQNSAKKTQSTVTFKKEPTDPADMTHSQRVDLQLVTSSSRLPAEIGKLFRQDFSPDLDKIRLNRLVANFEIAYQFGDLTKIDNLFLETIKSNKIAGKKAFKDEYKKLFNITQSRNIRIYDLLWTKEGDTVLGKGGFKVTIYERGSAQKSVFTGNIDLRVAEKNQSLLFSELFYNYGNP